MAMSPKWPFVAMLDDGNGWSSSPYWHMYKSHPNQNGPETLFIREDAARAWQAFRDWLNGTPEQWQQYAEGMYAYGRQIGWDDV